MVGVVDFVSVKCAGFCVSEIFRCLWIRILTRRQPQRVLQVLFAEIAIEAI